MKHVAIDQVLQRAERARGDADFTYFFSLLLASEAVAKAVVVGIVSTIGDDKDRNRYRLEHQLVRADGIGDWGKVLEDALIGQASHFLLTEARAEQAELTKAARKGDWQYDAVAKLKAALDHLQIESEEVPVKSDLKRWFRLFATLRNKTRAHGATQPAKAGGAATHLLESTQLVLDNFCLFQRPWAYLYRNFSGKYRVSAITADVASFDFLKKENHHSFPDGVYLFAGKPRRVPLVDSDPELLDFFFANGGFNGKRFELLSYCSDNKLDGDGTAYIAPPGTLPPSETQGSGELGVKGNCFSNAPDLTADYVGRPQLEQELHHLLLDDKRHIVTLRGSGGIGKTSLALKVIGALYTEARYQAVVWFSARDVDLHLSGPKPVRPLVLTPDDMGKLYASFLLTEEAMRVKGFNPRGYLEQQLQKCELGPCLFVFDNFETTQSPVEMFEWIDTFIRLPNKALITTRLRDFKGDYPVDVLGMGDDEALELIHQTAKRLGLAELITSDYAKDLISESSGHPYVIKILLGEVAKEGRRTNLPRIVAGSDEVLTALFERTYAMLSPCGQRAFLTLSAWNSAVPRLALEAVLLRSIEERAEVEKGVESLLQFSLAEAHVAPSDNQEFISLPLVASVFGKKKLNISQFRAAIQADVEVLQMLGPSRLDDVHLGLAKRLESFIKKVAARVDRGESFDTFAPILEMICRNYNVGWLLLARWHMEARSTEGYKKAQSELRRFLENETGTADAADAWKLLAHACYQMGDALGEIHAFIERAQLASVPFNDVSNTASRLNELLREVVGIGKDEKRALAQRLLLVMDRRLGEAEADDMSRMAWLAIQTGQEDKAREYASKGLTLEPDNFHCQNLMERLGKS